MNLHQSTFLKVTLALSAGLCLVITTLAPSRAWTKVEYDSSQLMMKTADEVSEMVRKKIKRAQEIQAKQEDNDGDMLAEPGAVDQLKDAMRIVLSRPDQDGTRANAFSRLRRELVDLNSLDSTLEELSKEAISTIQSSSTPPGRTGTYIVLLENLMAEIKPEVKSNATFRRIVESVRDADLKVSDKVKNQQLMRAMSKPTSPSETAAKILPKAKK
jgi:hypothetical protein